MSNSKLAVEYFTNVEFENIDDPHILQTIYNEIKVCYFTIINHNKLSYKLESLLEKSTHAQRLQFLLQIENNNCQTKLGSRIVEKIFDLCENNFTDEDIETLTEKYEKDFVEMFIHKNSTFVIRKMLNQQFSKLNNNNIENVILNLKKIFCEDNALITLQKYLDAIEKKQKLIKHIINDYWHIEDMKSRRSYLFQRIVELANSKNRTRIFEKIKDDFIELCTDRYANFIVQELVSRDKENILFYYNTVKKNIQMFEKNSNIVIKLCAALCDEHPDKMYKLASKFYLDGEDDIIKGIMIKNGMIDTKYTKLVRCIFRKGNSEIYKSFVDHFTLAWLKQKSGREIFEEYLNAKSADKKALLVKVKKQMGEYTEERKMMQYLDMIFKKYK